MNQYDETFKSWNSAAELYQEKFMGLRLYDETYDCFCDLLVAHGSSVLEVGCGPGNVAKYILEKRPDLDVFGVDVAPNMVALARKNNPTARFDVMDAREIDRMTSLYHGIVCGFCLPYLSPEDCGKLVDDCWNLLHPGGVIYLSFVEGNPQRSGFHVAGNGDRYFLYYHEVFAVLKKLEAKFSQVVVSKVNYMRKDAEAEEHVVVIARRKDEK